MNEIETESYASVWDAIADTPEQAANLRTRAELMQKIAAIVKESGWTQTEAAGKPLEDIFAIINEDSRRTVDNPIDRVLREGVVVGLANHTVLIARHGAEIPVDDSDVSNANDRISSPSSRRPCGPATTSCRSRPMSCATR